MLNDVFTENRAKDSCCLLDDACIGNDIDDAALVVADRMA